MHSQLASSSARRHVQLGLMQARGKQQTAKAIATYLEGMVESKYGKDDDMYKELMTEEEWQFPGAQHPESKEMSIWMNGREMGGYPGYPCNYIPPNLPTTAGERGNAGECKVQKAYSLKNVPSQSKNYMQQLYTNKDTGAVRPTVCQGCNTCQCKCTYTEMTLASVRLSFSDT